MGRLTDLLNQRMAEKNAEESALANADDLSARLPQKDVSDQAGKVLKDLSNQGKRQKDIFDQLPTIGEFFIPYTMNGRVIECADESFKETNQGKQVVAAKAYSFDGFLVKYLFFDPTDQTIQKGSFLEFPKDGLGNIMGQIGLKDQILVWKKKARANV